MAAGELSRYIAQEMDLDDLKSRLQDWGSSNKFIDSIYLYGSRVTDNYTESSDIDVAVVIDENELEPNYSSAMALWFAQKLSWQSDLKRILGDNLHLEWFHEKETKIVKSGIEASHILVYKKAI